MVDCEESGSDIVVRVSPTHQADKEGSATVAEGREWVDSKPRRGDRHCLLL